MNSYRASARHREHGQTLMLVAISMVGVLAMAALAIDVVTLYSAHSEVQRSADAGALAGAKMLVDSGVTGAPCDSTVATSAQTFATAAATAAAQQNLVSGVAPQAPTVTFPNGSAGCAFGINPQIRVQVQRTGLPTFFARIWSRNLATVSATATAEAYNPSNANSVSTVRTVGIAVRCMKPMIVPNCDPGKNTGGSCGGFQTFIDTSNGAITSPGVAPVGVIGEKILLSSGCAVGAGCVPSGAPVASPNILHYYPLQLSTGALRLCPENFSYCSSPATTFQQDLQCCNGSLVQCSQILPLDGTVYPDGAGGPAELGAQCAIHKAPGDPFDSTCSTNNDQDCLPDPTMLPFRLLAGTKNPFLSASVRAGDQVTTSDSVVSVALYDQPGANPPVSPFTIVGYLQLFIDDVDNTTHDIHATILNVAGCGTGLSGNPVQGAASAIPVRLIH